MGLAVWVCGALAVALVHLQEALAAVVASLDALQVGAEVNAKD
jgi:hypothetical protein